MVVSVHDGDTATLLLDLGFNVRVEVDVRLYGVQAPELNRGTAEQRRAGVEARDFVRSLLPEGSPVRVTTLLATSGEMTMTFARVVAALELPGFIPVDLATTLVATGHATWCDRNPRPLTESPPAIRRWTGGLA